MFRAKALLASVLGRLIALPLQRLACAPCTMASVVTSAFQDTDFCAGDPMDGMTL